MSLQKAIDKLAHDFASHVLHALRGASLADITAVTGRSLAGGKAAAAPKSRGRAGRLPRRSVEDIHRVLDGIVAAVKATSKGLRAEEIQAKLRLDKRELPRPIQEGLSSKRLIKKGKKRATTYFVGPRASAAPKKK